MSAASAAAVQLAESILRMEAAICRRVDLCIEAVHRVESEIIEWRGAHACTVASWKDAIAVVPGKTNSKRGRIDAKNLRELLARQAYPPYLMMSPQTTEKLHDAIRRGRAAAARKRAKRSSRKRGKP